MKGDKTMKDFHKREVWVENLKDGSVRYVLPYTNLAGVEKKKTRKYAKHSTKNKNEARFNMIEAIEKELDKESKKINGLSLAELFDMFLSKKKETLRRNSMLDYKSAIKNISLKIDTSNIDVENIDVQWLALTLESLNYKQSKTLRYVLRWAFEKHFIKNNVGNEIRIKKECSSKEKIEKSKRKLYYEKEELREIFDILDLEKSYTGQITRLAIEFQTLTGCRIGELLALTESDVEENLISINKTVSNSYVGDPKTVSSIRTLGINGRCKEILLEVKKLKVQFGVRSDIVFCGKKGNHLSDNSVRRFLNKNKLIPRTHIFRHTHASLLAEQGVELQAIMRRLGHENDAITRKIYIHVTEKMKESDFELFKNLDIL